MNKLQTAPWSRFSIIKTLCIFDQAISRIVQLLKYCSEIICFVEMAANAGFPTFEEKDRFSKEHRWYLKEIGERVSEDARILLEEYSHIPKNEIDEHIYQMVQNIFSLILCSL